MIAAQNIFSFEIEEFLTSETLLLFESFAFLYPQGIETKSHFAYFILQKESVNKIYSNSVILDIFFFSTQPLPQLKISSLEKD